DAIEEKKQAKSILLGETKVSDHYSSEENDFTKDSKFDPEYYDLKFLDPEDKISIVYLNRDRSFSNRDQITITDTGVGLGGNRLKGFFRPAFSTKRLNRKALGKFGIGSKSGLATGIESYQIMSRHNGREYYFDIYGDRFFSIVARFNDKGFENPHEVWKAKRYNDDGDVEEFDNIIYYTETELPNCVSVIMDIKNPIRNKSKYIDAVKSQLTYFKYVTLHEKYEDKNYSWREGEIHFKTDVLYQDEYLIIPKDNYYSVPHLILNGVNYGKYFAA
ncbi:MAG TPA: ATP-binding protein, partial [Tissierellaceae bacterium]|nr:ATP-binding protein [Tissierellaceae bacterium]